LVEPNDIELLRRADLPVRREPSALFLPRDSRDLALRLGERQRGSVAGRWILRQRGVNETNAEWRLGGSGTHGGQSQHEAR